MLFIDMISFSADTQISRALKIWLIIGLVMIFFQIVIGGVTRLTGSGLSITKWEVVRGTLPPLSAAQWETAFELYKQTPQYQKINQGMSMSDFKFIYFWEYFHRFWARLMGFVFLIPFCWFLLKGQFSKKLLPRMLIVVALAGLEGFFGWIMVKSGLIHRPWVNAYNLTLHLVTALVIFAYLLWTIFIAFRPEAPEWSNARLRQVGWAMVGVMFIQLALGAMMSGSKAGLFFPTWPDQGGSFIPAYLLDATQWKAEHFIDYDTNPFMPAFIQFLHRNTAYLLTIMVIWFVWKTQGLSPTSDMRFANRLMLVSLVVQVLLGITTLLQCKGSIPVLLGVLHQAGAVVLLSALLWVVYQVRGK
jgi:heme a synthase